VGGEMGRERKRELGEEEEGDYSVPRLARFVKQAELHSCVLRSNMCVHTCCSAFTLCSVLTHVHAHICVSIAWKQR